MKCYLCGSKNNHKREGKVRDDASINILECDECGLVFLDKQKTGDEFYENNEMLSQNFFKDAQRDKGSLEEQKRILDIDKSIVTQQRFNLLKRTLIGKRILDFGSGHAQFLILAKEIARSVAGVELENVDEIYQKHRIKLYKSLASIPNFNDRGGGGLIKS